MFIYFITTLRKNTQNPATLKIKKQNRRETYTIHWVSHKYHQINASLYDDKKTKEKLFNSIPLPKFHIKRTQKSTHPPPHIPFKNYSKPNHACKLFEKDIFSSFLRFLVHKLNAYIIYKCIILFSIQCHCFFCSHTHTVNSNQSAKHPINKILHDMGFIIN